MGVGENFGEAFAKAQLGAGTPLPAQGEVLFSVNKSDKPVAVEVARKFADLGFELYATRYCGRFAQRGAQSENGA